MLTNLHVKSYQSIADADLELGPFTVIVGENRAGKSAILRALGALAFNETGNDFVRKGERSTTVEVETDDEQRILWQKDSKGGARYRLDEREFTKLGASVPPEITQALGIRRIDIDQTTRVAPQFHEQGEYGFILKESAGKAARVLARLTKLDVIVQAQIECRRDTQRVKGDAKEADGSIMRLHEKLDVLPDVEPIKEKLQRLESAIDNADALVGACGRGLEVDGERAAAGRAAKVSLPYEARLLEVEAELDTVSAASEALRRYENAKDAVVAAKAEQKRTAGVYDGARWVWQDVVKKLNLCAHCPLREGSE